MKKGMSKALAGDVLRLVALGQGDLQIANALGIKLKYVHTVRTSPIWAKLRAQIGVGASIVSTPILPSPTARRRRGFSSQGVPPSSRPSAVLTEPVIGFRMWYVRDDGQPRATAHTNIVWTARVDATCVRGGAHVAPEESCECGIHANNSMKTMEDRLGGYPGSAGNYVVVAAVLLWGKVIEATAGYRAEHAQVIAVATPKPEFVTVCSDEMVTATAAHNLGVPVVPYNQLAVYASEYGAMVDEDYARVERRRLALKAHMEFRESQRTYREGGA